MDEDVTDDATITGIKKLPSLSGQHTRELTPEKKKILVQSESETLEEKFEIPQKVLNDTHTLQKKKVLVQSELETSEDKTEIPQNVLDDTHSIEEKNNEHFDGQKMSDETKTCATPDSSDMLIEQLKQAENDLVCAKESHEKEMKNMLEMLEETNTGWKKKLEENEMSLREERASILDKQQENISSLTSTLHEQEALLSRLIVKTKAKEEQLCLLGNELDNVKSLAVQLQSSNVDFISETQGLRTKVESANATITSLQIRLDDAVVDLQTVKREYEALQSDHLQIMKESKEMSEERDVMEDKVQEMEQKIQDLKAMEDTCTTLESQLAEIRNHEKELVETIDAMEEAFNGVTCELKTLKGEHSLLKELFQKLSEEKDLIAKELYESTAAMQSRIDEYENAVSSRDSKLELLHQGHEDLLAEQSRLLDDLTKLKMSLNSLDEENQYCKEIISQLEKAEALRDEELSQLHASNKTLTKKSESLEADLKEKQSSLDKLQVARNEDAESLKQFKVLNHKANEKVYNLERSFESSAQNIKELSKENEQLLVKNEELNKKLETAMTTENSLMEMKAEVIRVTGINTEMESTVLALHIQIEDLKSKNTALEENVSNFETVVASSTDQLEDERLKHEDVVQNLIADANESKDVIATELNSLKVSFETLNKQKLALDELAEKRLAIIDDHQKQLAALDASLNDKQCTETLMQQKLDEAQNCNNALQDELKSVSDRLFKFTAENDKAVESLEKLQLKYDEVCNLLQQKETAASLLTDEVQLLKHRQLSTESEIAKLAEANAKNQRILKEKLNESEEKEKNLQSQLAQSQQDLSSEKDLVEKLQSQNGDLEVKLADTKETYQQLVSNLQDANSDLQAQLEHVEAKNVSLNDSVVDLKSTVASLNKQIAEEKLKHEGCLSAVTAEAKESRQILDTEIKNLKLSLDELSASTVASNELAAERLNALNDYKQQANDLSNKFKDAQRKCESYEIELARAKQTLDQQVAGFQEEVQAKNAKILELDAEKSHVARDLNTSKQELADTYEKLNSEQKTVCDINEKIMGLEQNLNLKTNFILQLKEDHERENSKLAEDLQYAKEQICVLHCQLEQSETRLADANAVVNKLTQSEERLSDAHSQISLLQTRNDEKETKIGSLMFEYQKLVDRVKELANEVEIKHQKLMVIESVTIPELEANLSANESTLDKLESVKNEMELECSHLSSENCKNMEEKLTLQENIDVLLSKYEQQETDLDALKTYMHTLQDTNVCLTEEIQQLGEDLAKEEHCGVEAKHALMKATEKVSEQAQEITILKNQNQLLSEKLEETTDEKELVEDVLKNKNNLVEENLQRIKGLQNELEEAHKALMEHKNKKMSAEQECETIHSNMKLLRSAAKESQKKIDNLEALYSRISLDNANLREENESLILDVGTASQTVEDLEKQLAESKKKLEEMNATDFVVKKQILDIKMLTEVNAKLLEDFESTCREVENKIQDCEALEEAVDGLTREKRHMKDDNEELVSRSIVLENKLIFSERLWSDNFSDVEILRFEIDLMLQQYQSVKEECIQLQKMLKHKDRVCLQQRKILNYADLEMEKMQTLFMKVAAERDSLKTKVIAEQDRLQIMQIEKTRLLKRSMKMEEIEALLQKIVNERDMLKKKVVDGKEQIHFVHLKNNQLLKRCMKMEETEAFLQKVVDERDRLEKKVVDREEKIQKLETDEKSKTIQLNVVCLLNQQMGLVSTKLGDMKKQCQNMNESLKQKEAEVIRLKAAFSASTNANFSLKEDLSTSQRCLRETKIELESVSVQLKASKNQADSKCLEVNKLISEVLSVREQLFDALENSRVTHNQLQQDIVSLKISDSKLREKLAEKNASCEQLIQEKETQSARLDDEIAQRKLEKLASNDLQKQYEVDLAALTAKCSQLSAEVDNLKKLADDFKVKQEQNSSTIQDSQKEIDSLLGIKSNLLIKLNDAICENAILQEKVNGLSIELADLRRDAAVEKIAYQNLCNSKDKSDKRNQQLSESVEEFKDRNEILQDDFNRLVEKLSNFEKELMQSKYSAGKSNISAIELKEQLDRVSFEKDAEKTMLEIKIQSLEQQTTTLKSQNEHRVSLLDAELDDLRKDKINLNTALKETERKLKLKYLEMNDAEEKLQNVNQRLEDIHHKYHKLTTSVQELKTSLSAKEFELSAAIGSLTNKDAEILELQNKQAALQQNLCNEVKEKNSKIITLHEDLMKSELDFENARNSLAISEENTTNQEKALKSLKQKLSKAELKLVEIQNENALNKDTLDELQKEQISLIQKIKDLESSKRIVMRELEKVRADLASSHENHDAKCKELQEQKAKQHDQLQLWSEREKNLQIELSNCNVKIEELNLKCFSDTKKIQDFSSLIKKLKNDQASYINKISLAEKDMIEVQREHLLSSQAKQKQIDQLASNDMLSTKRISMLSDGLSRLKEEKSRLNEEVARLNEQLSRVNDEALRLNTEAAAFSEESTLTSKKLMDLNQQIVGTNQEIAQAHEKCSDLQSSLSAKDMLLQSKETEIKDWKVKVASLEMKKHELSHAIEKKTFSIQELKYKVELLQMTNGELNLREKEIENVVKEARMDISKLKNDMSSCKQQYETQIDALAAQLKAQEEDINFKKRQNDLLKSEVNCFSKKAEDLQAKSAKDDKKLKNLASAISKLEEVQKNNREEIASSNNKVSELQHELEMNVQRKEREISELRSKMTFLNDEIILLESKILEADTKIARLTSEKAQMLMNSNNQITELREQGFQLNQRLVASDSIVNRLKDRISSLQSTLDVKCALLTQHQEQEKGLNQEKELLLVQIKAKETEIDECGKTFLKYEKILEDAETSTHDLKAELEDLKKNQIKMEDLMEKLKSERHKIENKLIATNDFLDEKCKMINELQERLSEEQIKVADHEKVIALNEQNSHNQLTVLYGDVEKLSESLSSLEADRHLEMKTLQKSFQTREIEFIDNLDNLCKKVEGLQMEIQKMLDRNTVLDDEIINLNTAKKDAETELRSIKSHWEKHDVRVSVRLDEVINSFEKLQLDVNLAAEEKNQLKQQIGTLTKDVEILSQQNDRLAALEPKNALLSKEVDALRGRFSLLKSSINRKDNELNCALNMLNGKTDSFSRPEKVAVSSSVPTSATKPERKESRLRPKRIFKKYLKLDKQVKGEEFYNQSEGPQSSTPHSSMSHPAEKSGYASSVVDKDTDDGSEPTLLFKASSTDDVLQQDGANELFGIAKSSPDESVLSLPSPPTNQPGNLKKFTGKSPSKVLGLLKNSFMC